MVGAGTTTVGGAATDGGRTDAGLIEGALTEGALMDGARATSGSERGAGVITLVVVVTVFVPSIGEPCCDPPGNGGAGAKDLETAVGAAGRSATGRAVDSAAGCAIMVSSTTLSIFSTTASVFCFAFFLPLPVVNTVPAAALEGGSVIISSVTVFSLTVPSSSTVRS